MPFFLLASYCDLIKCELLDPEVASLVCLGKIYQSWIWDLIQILEIKKELASFYYQLFLVFKNLLIRSFLLMRHRVLIRLL